MTRDEFIDIKEMNNWCAPRFLLWPGLEAVKDLKLPILELGAGHGSSPYIRRYCKENGLEFFPYDIDKEWADRMGVNHVNSWEELDWRKEYGLAFIDHSPGDHRRIAVSRLHHVKVVVIHDSEVAGWNSSDYQVQPVLEKYRYKFDLKPKEGRGAWTTVVSNFIDVSKWVL